MDLRNRDGFEKIITELNGVPAEQPRDLAQRLHALATEDRATDLAAMSESTTLLETEALARMRRVGHRQGRLRIHVFSSVERVNGRENFSLRVCSDELCLSSFVNRVDLKLSGGETVAWTRQSNDDAVDGVTVDRPLGSGGEVEISIHVSYENCLYAVPAIIARDGKYMSFVHLFKALCAYIKEHNLSSNDDPSYFTPDQALHDLLYPNHPKQHPVSFASLLEVIRAHFKPVGPFRIVHKIGGPEQVFDLKVQLPDEVDDSASVALEEAERKLANKLNEIDREIGDLTAGIEQLARNTRFIDKVAANPIEFFQQVLHTPTGAPNKIESAGLVDYMQMSTCHEFYQQPWAVAAATFVINEQKKENPVS